MAYCDSTDLKRWLSIDDTVDDSILEQVLSAAEDRIDAYCGRSFTVASGTSTWYVEPAETGWCIETPDFASTSGLVVETTYDHATWTALTSNTDYVAYPLNRGTLNLPYDEIKFNMLPALPWDHRPTVRITAAFGWSAVPDPVTYACKVQAARWFRRKDTPDGLAGGGDFGQIRVNSKLDPDVCDALNPYRKGSEAQGLVIG